jgi:hypothetical protein
MCVCLFFPYFLILSVGNPRFAQPKTIPGKWVSRVSYFRALPDGSIYAICSNSILVVGVQKEQFVILSCFNLNLSQDSVDSSVPGFT